MPKGPSGLGSPGALWQAGAETLPDLDLLRMQNRKHTDPWARRFIKTRARDAVEADMTTTGTKWSQETTRYTR